MISILKGICIGFLMSSISMLSYAECDCPSPRPMNATATSGVLTLEYEEEFTAKKQVPDRIEIVLQPDRVLEGTGIVGHINELVRRLEAEFRQNFQRMGITAEISVEILHDNSRNLSGDGFRFMKSVSGPDQNNETLTISGYARPVYENSVPPKPKVLKKKVQKRASICGKRCYTPDV